MIGQVGEADGGVPRCGGWGREPAAVDLERDPGLVGVGPATDERLADHLHNPLLPAWPRRGDDRLLSFARAVRQVVTAGTSGVHSS